MKNFLWSFNTEKNLKSLKSSTAEGSILDEEQSNTIEAFNNRESVSDLEKLIIEATYYSRRQEYDRAYDAATQLTENYPDISRAWSISAEIKSITGDLYESIEESEEAIALDPDNFSAYLNLLTKPLADVLHS